MSRASKYSKPQFERLQKSVNYLLPHISRKQQFTETFGNVYFPKHSKKRARELTKIREALQLLASVDFNNIR